MKTCTKCKEEKESSLFYKKKSHNDGLHYTCKKCEVIDKLKLNRTKEGKLKSVYDSQVLHSKKRNHKPPLYTKKEFVNMFINCPVYLIHYNYWVSKNYLKKYAPSFDRKDDYKKYSFDNIKIMYWYQNNEKSHLDNKNGTNKKSSKPVTGTNVLTGKKIEFYSAKEAGRNGFCCKGISATCIGRQKTHKGHVWKFKNND